MKQIEYYMLSTHQFIITGTVTHAVLNLFQPVIKPACRTHISQRRAPVQQPPYLKQSTTKKEPGEKSLYSTTGSFILSLLSFWGLLQGFLSHSTVWSVFMSFTVYVQGQILSLACGRKRPQGSDFNSVCQDN